MHSRLTDVFFGLFLFFLGTTVAIGWFFFGFLEERSGLAELKNSLLNQATLQRQLLQGNHAEHSLIPHADPHIGYVLNYNFGNGNTSLWADEGGQYQINSLGLRGPEIVKKAPGAKRIVLVSDSWLYGWRLSDKDRVEAALKALLAHYYPGLALEVVTVAMPGWNVENEAAFLDDHAAIISPDVLIWTINSNDLWDTAGVLPPGFLSFKVSRSSQWVCPETYFPEQRWQVPFVLEGWKKNIALMNAAQRSFGAPVMALFAHEYRDVVTMIRNVAKPEFEIFSTPQEYQIEQRWGVQYPNDSHPSKWGSNLIAIDLLARLMSSGFLPQVALEPEHQAVAEKGRAASQAVAPEKLQEMLQANLVYPYPRAYDRSSDPPKIRNVGITDEWKVCPEGRLILQPEADAVEISFDEVGPMPNQLTCEARSMSSKASGIGTVQNGNASCRVDMPRDGLPIEMVWHFSRFVCSGAQDCYAGRFKSLRSVKR
jgi:hypothetical protein